MLVGVENNNGVPFLFFKSKKTGKRLKFVSTSMVNFSDSVMFLIFQNFW